jgi:hypothetical protein
MIARPQLSPTCAGSFLSAGLESGSRLYSPCVHCLGEQNSCLQLPVCLPLNPTQSYSILLNPTQSYSILQLPVCRAGVWQSSLLAMCSLHRETDFLSAASCLPGWSLAVVFTRHVFTASGNRLPVCSFLSACPSILQSTSSTPTVYIIPRHLQLAIRCDDVQFCFN